MKVLFMILCMYICYCLFSDYNVLSNFTWNFFEDSGWYRVNFTFTETAVEQFDLQWGRGLLLCKLQHTAGLIMYLCLHGCFDALSVVGLPWPLLTSDEIYFTKGLFGIII